MLASEQLSSPSGKVILSISGKIEQHNSGDEVLLDRQMLESLPQYQFTTETPWTEGPHQYQGVLLSELLRHIGARGDTIIAYALNDYFAEINLKQIRDYPIILALKNDGKAMRVRDKGPIWIMYPLSKYPELDNSIHHASMVWQLNRLEVR